MNRGCIEYEDKRKEMYRAAHTHTHKKINGVIK